MKNINDIIILKNFMYDMSNTSVNDNRTYILNKYINQTSNAELIKIMKESTNFLTK